MELGSFYRALRDRWVLVAALAIMGFVASVGLTATAAGQETDVYVATASIQFPVASEEEGALTVDLTEALTSAQTAAQSLISEDPANRYVNSDPLTGLLRFIAKASDPDVAREIATKMRQAYVDVDPLAGVDVGERIAAIEEETRLLNSELLSLNAVDQAVVEQHEFVDFQIEALEQRLRELAVAKATADDETLPTYVDEEERIQDALEDLYAQKAELPSLEIADPIDNFRQVAIQRRLDVLALDYERLYLRQLGITTGGTLHEVVVRNETPPAPSLLVNGLLGVVVGLVLASLAIAFDARFRRPVWVADDVSLPVLGEIPSRRLHADGKLWYDREARHPRKYAIQALRAAVEGRLPGRSFSIAVGGIKCSPAMVQTLVLDLAASFASAGWSVLVVDTQLNLAAPPAELKGTGPTLAQVLSQPGEDPDAVRRAAVGAVESATSLRTNVAVVSAGTGQDSAADALSGAGFPIFLEEATSRFDLVLMVGDDLRTPAGQVLFQRLDYGILCLVPGRTPSAAVERLIEELGDRRVVFLGATFLHRRGVPRAVVEPVPVVEVSPPVTVSDRPRSRERAQVPVVRIGDLELAGSARGSGAGPSSLGGRAGHSTPPPRPPRGGLSDGWRGLEPYLPGDRVTALQAEMLQALDAVERGAYEEVAGYITRWVTSLITGERKDFSGDALSSVRAGFVPLHEVKGYHSVGMVLTNEFRNQLGSKLGGRLATEAAWVLSEGFEATGVTLGLDAWLAFEYFRRHVEATNHQPRVWHLASRHGTVQVLVDSTRLDRDCLDDLSEQIVLRTIEALERNLKAAVRAGRKDAVEKLGEELADARTFEIALGWLYEGTTPNSRLIYPKLDPTQQPKGWNPVWTEGIRPNLAPLQRLGLLALPVLSDDELAALRSSA